MFVSLKGAPPGQFLSTFAHSHTKAHIHAHVVTYIYIIMGHEREVCGSIFPRLSPRLHERRHGRGTKNIRCNTMDGRL